MQDFGGPGGSVNAGHDGTGRSSRNTCVINRALDDDIDGNYMSLICEGWIRALTGRPIPHPDAIRGHGAPMTRDRAKAVGELIFQTYDDIPNVMERASRWALSNPHLPLTEEEAAVAAHGDCPQLIQDLKGLMPKYRASGSGRGCRGKSILSICYWAEIGRSIQKIKLIIYHGLPGAAAIRRYLSTGSYPDFDGRNPQAALARTLWGARHTDMLKYSPIPAALFDLYGPGAAFLVPTTVAMKRSGIEPASAAELFNVLDGEIDKQGILRDLCRELDRSFVSPLLKRQLPPVARKVCFNLDVENCTIAEALREIGSSGIIRPAGSHWKG